MIPVYHKKYSFRFSRFLRFFSQSQLAESLEESIQSVLRALQLVTVFDISMNLSYLRSEFKIQLFLSTFSVATILEHFFHLKSIRE